MSTNIRDKAIISLASAMVSLSVFSQSTDQNYVKADKYLFEGGYAQASVASSTTDNFAFYYYNQDHLGNIREVVNESGTVQQVTNYYPFGAPYADTAGSTNPDFQPYKYNGKELDKMHGLNTYDYGARQHDPILARWDRIDPLCEKYYSMSPYAYCGNSPIKNIDPDGMDWYKDKDGSIQYNSGVHSQDDLSKGQTYLWVAKNDKKAGVDYRNDGSIIYNNETVAYNRIWKQADTHYRTKDSKGGREVTGFILSNGKVLVLPDYKNDATTSYISEYGYKVNKDGTLSHGKEKFNVLGNIHSHQSRSASAAPSFYTYNGYGDMGISIQMGGKPVLTIGWDGEIHGIRSNSIETLYQIPFSQKLRQRDNLLNGYTKLSKILKRY